MKNLHIQKQILEEEEDPINGDILEVVLSHVPLTDLLLASHVSNSWNLAVESSLRYHNAPKPWLLLHTQTSRPPYAATTHAYDPRSDVWIRFSSPVVKYVNVLRSSQSYLLYMISPWSFSFSVDSLHMTWHHAPAPLVWRTDPIVAVVGRRVVVAGGTCGFEDDLLAMEIYDMETRAWTTCESMPSLLKDSAASTWLSVAVNDQKVFVTEKHSGVTYSFDPETLNWFGPYEIRPDPKIFYSVIGFADNHLIVTGLLGQPENVAGVKLYEVDTESFKCVEIAEMPISVIKILKRECFEITSIGVCMAGKYIYIHNPAEIGQVFVCELFNGGSRWRSVRNAVADDSSRLGRFVFTCCKVSLDDLKKAMRLERCKFQVIDSEPKAESTRSVVALMAIKSDLNDPHNVLENWDITSVDPCSWRMVTCSSDGYVSVLGLPSQSLSGTLSPGIGNLTNLQSVIMSFLALFQLRLGDWRSCRHSISPLISFTVKCPVHLATFEI